ncbi:trypsin-like peptidase domain-containing protein [Kitasatospora sp. NPDC051853]|uniref:nSTAND1 domain-containing NTPase n=1 Tax=Kitasatospora sp. NPDC051853 TaxID=3364058 RepID=UPI0037A7B18F
MSPDLALTCAHVVVAALGLEHGAWPEPGDGPEVDLPLHGAAGRPRVRTTIERWVPRERDGTGDVAVLRLGAPVAGARAVGLVQAGDVWGHSARAFGVPVGRDGGVWHSGILRASQTEGLLQVDMEANGYRVSPGFSGGPVWDNELAGVVGMMVAAEAASPPSSYLIPTEGLLAAWPELADHALPKSPFRGLAPLGEADAGLFHGRQTETVELTALALRERWTTLVGPSGAGKSSLAMAGVVPRLRSLGVVPLVVRPSSGADPLSALAAALLRILDPGLSRPDIAARTPDVADHLRRRGLGDHTAQVLEAHAGHRLVVVVDQFEELLARSTQVVDDLAEVLFAESLPPAVGVLVTLRADFLEEVLAHPRLGPLCSRQLYALGPMTESQLREIVGAPLRTTPGVRYEPHLVERILTDTGSDPGALPLLSFALDLLWRQRRGSLLSHQTYEEIGRIEGALNSYANQQWRLRVKADDDTVAKRLLTRLVRLPLGTQAATRRTVPRAELGEDEWRVAQHLAVGRLLVLSHSAEGQQVVELAHETLISGWELLREQAREDRTFLEWRESLRHDLERWEAGGRAADLLPTLPALAAAQPWLSERRAELTGDEIVYLAAGHRHHRARTRRRRVVRALLGSLAALAMVMGTLVAVTSREAAERRADADSRALAQASQDEASHDPARAAMLAMAGYDAAPTQEARNQLLREYVTHRQDDRILSGLLGKVGAFATSRDGDVVLVRTDLGRATLFLHALTGTVRSIPLDAAYVIQPLVTPDGRRAGFVNSNGAAGWFDIDPGAADPVGPLHLLPATSLVESFPFSPWDRAAMSADGRFIAVGWDHRLVWWDLTAGIVAGDLKVRQYLRRHVWLTPDGQTLLAETGSEEEVLVAGLIAIDTTSRSVRTVLADRTQSLLLSGDRDTVVVQYEEKAESDGVARSRAVLTRHRTSDGAPVGQPFRSDGIAIDPRAADVTGRRVVTGAADRLSVVDLDQGQMVARLTASAPAVGFARDMAVRGDRLYLAELRDSAIVYVQVPSEESLITATHVELIGEGGSEVLKLADGRYQLRTAGEDSQVLAETPAVPTTWVDREDLLRLNVDNTLVALRDGANTVMIRETGTLRPSVRITATPPPTVHGKPGELRYLFDFGRPGDLLTVSGTTVERWDTRTGLLRTRLDIATVLRDPYPNVSDYPQEGMVVAWSEGSPVLNVIELSTGRITASLDTGHNDITGVGFDSEGKYFGLMLQGARVEMWRREPLRREVGPLPGVTGVDQQEWDARFLDGDGRFMIAANNAVRIYRPGKQAYVDSYDFGRRADSQRQNPFSFHSVARGGKAVLYSDEKRNGTTLVLDPADWRRRLCRIIGYRSFTEDERRSLPVQVPTHPLCPPP